MRSSTASSVACCAKRALRVRVCDFRDFRNTLMKECLDESREARASGLWVGAIIRSGTVGPQHATLAVITSGTQSNDEPRCQVLPARKDTGARASASPCAAQSHAASVQEFRQELQAAETKDKKFTKRKTILKKIVANITMGNDSSYCNVCWRVLVLMGVRCSQCHLCSSTLCSVSGHLC
jgi:hypothetical protein